MSQPVKYAIERSFIDRLKSHGFCLDDPDRRYPTRNDFPSLILNLKRSGGRNKVGLLLGDRAGRRNPERSRLLAWLAPPAGLAGWPKAAVAHDHHSPLSPRFGDLLLAKLPATSPDPEPVTSFPDWAFDLPNLPGFSDPIWALAIGGALLMTQTIGILQRRMILKASTAQPVDKQPDLFPDTVPEEPAKPVKPKWQVDAATRQGQVRSENQDALEVLRFDDGSVAMIICDGAGGIGGGREASQSATKAISISLCRIWEKDGHLAGVDMETAIAEARQVARDNALEGVTTALLVLLDGEQMHYATLGDGAVAVIWPDGMVGPVQVPHHTLGRPPNEIGAYVGGTCDAPARIGTLRLEPGAIVLAMSDGTSDLFNFEDFARDRHKYKTLTGLSDHLLAHLEAARDPDTSAWLHSDNMTLAMARMSVEDSDDKAH